MKKTAIALLVLAGSSVANTAMADGFYAGIGLGYSSAESLAAPGGGSGASELDTALIGVTGGYRWDTDTGFLAAEVDASIPRDSNLTNTVSGATCPVPALPGATGAYFCSYDATVRIRGIWGASVGSGWELFGSAGFGMAIGQGATSTAAVDKAVTGGLTGGFGAQKAIGNGNLRVEFVHDRFSSGIDKPNGTFTPKWEANTLKASYLFSF